MKWARIVFGGAALYGFISLTPLYFFIQAIGNVAPPPVTHAEFYYGFVGLALVWQVVFVVIAKDPIRYRTLMPIAVLEKVVFTAPVLLLFSTGRVQPKIVGPALIDPIFGVLFTVAYFRTSTR